MFLLALSPILWLVVALSILKMAAHKACAIALIISLAVGCGIYGMESVNAATATLEGVALACWPILLVIIAAIFITVSSICCIIIVSIIITNIAIAIIFFNCRINYILN